MISFSSDSVIDTEVAVNRGDLHSNSRTSGMIRICVGGL